LPCIFSFSPKPSQLSFIFYYIFIIIAKIGFVKQKMQLYNFYTVVLKIFFVLLFTKAKIYDIILRLQ